jgi:competence protein ComGE
MWWKSNRGFFLLELLLSLSAWFLMCLFLLPILIDLNSQTVQAEINKKAQQLVFEELQANLQGNQSSSSYSIFESGVEYQVSWRDSVLNGNKEVCVKVEHNPFQVKTEICGMEE